MGHAVTMARSRSIMGPYEVDSQNPILTSRYDQELTLQKAGHADIVETQNGEWYMVHLSGRPLPEKNRCVLGRETCIQKMKWTEDNWLRMEACGNKPGVNVPAPDLCEYKFELEPERDDFDRDILNINFQSLRIPLDEDILTLKERPGFLRLKGRESLSSKHCQALIARRQQAFCYSASTCVEFEPESYQQMAGLICMYDTQNFYYLKISQDEEMGKCLGILTCDNNDFNYPLDTDVCIEGWKKCFLKVNVEYDRLQFSYSAEGVNWSTIGPVCDASTLSDEYCQEGRFTGAFIGLCCQDLSGQRKYADFDYFDYVEK